MSHPERTSLDLGDDWLLAQGELEGRPMILRIRSNLGDQCVGHPELGSRLRVVWSYEPEDEFGLPSSDTMQAMEQCENALVGSFEPDRTAVLTHVTTSGGLRQWVFYASDIDECVERVNGVLPQEDPLPLELMVDPDESWSEYSEVLAAVEG